jgi:N-acetylmuramoyl-L-alanine amidase
LPTLRLSLALPAALLAGVLIHAQGTPPAAPLVLLTREGRRPIPTILQSGQELVALDDVAALFHVTVREDALAGGVTVGYKGRTVLASPDQPMASVNGRLVALPSPAVRAGNRWLVPVEFLSRALAPIYDMPIELRKPSRLVILGALRVPRVTVRIEAVGPPTRVAVDITPAAPGSTAHEDSRILIRIDADAIDPALPASGGGLVEQVRLGDQPTTIVLQLKSAGAVNVATTSTPTGARITLDISAAETQVRPSPPVAAPSTEPLPELTAPPVALQTIVLDPGHGGDDVGTRGAAGVLEKNLTLDVARRAKALIEARLGIRVILTREDDRRVGPDERAAAANNSKADLFVSLHANAAFVPSVAGAEVFYVSMDAEMEAARIAAQSQSVSLPSLGGGTRSLDVIRWDLAQARHVESSAVLARLLEEELRARVPLGPRPTQQAPQRVLVGVNMPAALVEMAYLSNESQAMQDASPEFQTDIAQVIYETVLRFRSYLEALP